MYRWTKAQARENNIVDAYNFNKEYDNYKGVINGGVDRDNLPESCLSSSHYATGTLVQYFFVQGISVPLEYCYFQHDMSYPDWFGISYQKYSGGWLASDEYIEEYFYEGMLTIEFNCMTQIGPGYLSGLRLPHFEIELLIDGNVIASSGRFYNSITTLNLNATIPISTGTHKINIQWKLLSLDDESSPAVTPPTSPLGSFEGGSILAINRIR